MAGIEYINADSKEQVLSSLNESFGNAKIVAGATDLMLELEKGLHPDIRTFIDISRISKLKRIYIDGKGFIHLGALVTHNECIASPLLRQFALPLVMACWEVGSPQIRNRGTVVGNLVTGSPANDTITPLMALNAQLKLVSLHSSRWVPLREFYKGVRSTVILPNELVEDIIFRKMEPNQKGVFFKFALRQAQAISVVNAAVVLDLRGQVIEKAEITLGAVAPTIVNAKEAERYLTGKKLTSEVIKEAGSLAAEAAIPISDLRASASYRKYLVQVLVGRALDWIRNDEEQTRLIDRPALLTHSSSHQSIKPFSAPITTIINGKQYHFKIDRMKSLLDLLREDAGLVGTKEGCAEGECGACTVHLDGAAVMSCLVPAHRAHGANIVTIEGIASPDRLHPIQQAFIDSGAVQCGYCTPGLIMSGVKLLEEIPRPTANQITHALTGNLCRCTGYYQVIKAVEKAAIGGE